MGKKKKESKPKAPKVQPQQYRGIGDQVSLDAALEQAAHMLDLASVQATANGDPEAMAKVATNWASLAKTMVDVFNESQSKQPLGFSGSK